MRFWSGPISTALKVGWLCRESTVSWGRGWNPVVGRAPPFPGREGGGATQVGWVSGQGWLPRATGTFPRQGRTQPKTGCCGFAFWGRDSWSRTQGAAERLEIRFPHTQLCPCLRCPISLCSHQWAQRSKRTPMNFGLSSEGTGRWMSGFPDRGPGLSSIVFSRQEKPGSIFS